MQVPNGIFDPMIASLPNEIKLPEPPSGINFASTESLNETSSRGIRKVAKHGNGSGSQNEPITKSRTNGSGSQNEPTPTKEGNGSQGKPTRPLPSGPVWA
jgi:hypothetical protein